MTNQLPVSHETKMNGTANMLVVIERAASNKEVDVSKMQALLDMQMQMMAKQAEIEFNEAMNRLQPKLPMIEKTAKAEHHKYAKHEHVEGVIRPLYTKEGFSPTYTSEHNPDGTETFYGVLSHSSGHSKTHKITLPMDDVNKSKNRLQASVATLTYAKRVLLGMMFNLVFKDEDTDGALLDTVIDDAQFQELQRLIDESKTDTAGFCNHLKVSSLSAITQKQYPKAAHDLKAKLDKMKVKK